MPRMFYRKPSCATWVAVLAALLAPSWSAAQGTTAAETHAVRKGDTLWDLAKKYRGDPFLWPDIYRLNTAVVEDPHWIYPGEVLRLSGADNVAAVSGPDTPAPAAPAADSMARKAGGVVAVTGDSSARSLSDTSTEAGDDSQPPRFPTSGGQVLRDTLLANAKRVYRPLRRSEFYSSGFLTENQELPLGTMLGPVTPTQIRSVSNRDVATLFTNVGVEPPQGATYQVGDSLLIVQLGAEIEGYGRTVIPTGFAQITETTDGRYVATILAVYGAIRKGQGVLPAEKFRAPGNVRAKAVADGIRGHLLGGKGRQELKAPQMVVFIDKGRQDGVAPGDLFEARRQPKRLPDGTVRVDDVMAQFQIVHVRERSATARILNVLSPDLPAGTEVRQVAKLP